MTVDFQGNEIQTGDGPAGALPFIYGHVDPTLFPIARMQAATREALRRYGPLALNYGAPRGCGPLLAFLQAKLARDEGLALSDEHLTLTFGASGALDTICRLYTAPGDTVLVEAPSYHEALAVILDYRVHLAAVPLDDEGILIDALARRLEALTDAGKRPRLLYTIPTFQNPSGVTLCAARRPALLALARQYELIVVEDDVYRDLAFTRHTPPSLYALDAADGGETVIRLGSFSKILAPGLRLGWALAAPAHIATLIDSGLNTSGGGVNPFAAFVTAVFCQNGWLEPHIARLVRVYRRRRDVMLAALENSMPDNVHWTQPEGGFFVWLTLPESIQARDVLAQGHRHDITFLTGEPFFAQSGGEHHIRLPYSFIPPTEMEQGVHALAKIIRSQLKAVSD